MDLVHILRSDGTAESFAATERGGALLARVKQEIGVTCVDTVNLRDGRVMIVDDAGLIDDKPVNAAATAIYHKLCRPGTTSPICGDVAVCLDAWFE